MAPILGVRRAAYAPCTDHQHPRERCERGSRDERSEVAPFSPMFFEEWFAGGEPDEEKDGLEKVFIS